MAYDPHVVSEIERALDDRNATPKLRKAAWESVIVESGVHNLNYGDRDSLGPFQQRPSQGWMHATDPYKATLDFISHAEPIARKYGNAGALAQAVQRSAFPDRYQQVAGQADQLLRGHGGGAATSTSSKPAADTSSDTSSGTPSVLDQLGGSGVDFAGLLAALSPQQEAAPVASALPAPSFVAGPRLPSGFAALTPTQTAAPQPGVSNALGLLAAMGGGLGADVSSAEQGRQETAADGAQAPSSRPGASVVSPHAKAGVPVVSSRQSVGGAHETAGLPGYPAHDFFAPAGTHAVAPVAGKVVKLSGHDPANGPTNGSHGPLGWSVYIEGADGKTYFLTHMGSRDVKVGQTVRQGQVIGTVADYDKYGTPSHIHMGVHG